MIVQSRWKPLIIFPVLTPLKAIICFVLGLSLGRGVEGAEALLNISFAEPGNGSSEFTSLQGKRKLVRGGETTFGSSYREVRKLRVREIGIPLYVNLLKNISRFPRD